MTSFPPPPDHEVRALATDLQRDVFLSAGAGTGKTTVLVSRYMTALEAGLSPEQVVAITFTVKAAAEMRDRLRAQCRRKVEESSPEEARHWRQVLSQLEAAPINTIHGFCAGLLRGYALAAGLDPHFTIMEERPAWLLRRRIVKQTLLERLAEGIESSVLVFGEYGARQAQGLMHRILDDREHHVRWLQDPPSAEQVIRYWEQITPELLDELINVVLASPKLRDALSVLQRNPPVEADATYADRCYTVCTRLEEAIGSASTSAEYRLGLLRDACRAIAGEMKSSKCKGWSGPEQFELVKAALKNIREVLTPLASIGESLSDIESTRAAATLTAAMWQESAACSRAFEEAKTARSALDFTDLELHTARLLADDPSVVEQCRQRYRQVMVDEFQDTNDMQKSIVWTLCGFDSSNPEREGPRLFVVGDAKQSIYGFRSADVAVFRAAEGEFAGGVEGIDSLVLKAGFRTAATLSGFHNWFFADETVMGTGQKPLFEAVFQPVETQRRGREDRRAGEVLLSMVGTQDDDEEPVTAQLRREQDAAKVAGRLKEMLENGFRLEDPDGQLRPLRHDDIALLFRATTDINVYERALRDLKIAFHSVVGRGFWYRPEVSDLLNMVRVLDNSRDEVALAAVLRSPMFGFSDNDLYRAALCGDTLSDGLEQLAAGETQPEPPHESVQKARWACRKLERFRRLSGAVPLSRLLETVVDETGYSAAMAAQSDGPRRVANMDKLIDVSRGFEREGGYGLGDFVAYVQSLRQIDDREGEAPLGKATEGVVQLLTVHKAKGLEWPVVVIPDLGRAHQRASKDMVSSAQYGICARCGLDGEGNNLQCGVGELIRWAEARKATAEERRVLYVAATRARDYLIMSAAANPEDRRTYQADTWLDWLAGAAGWDLAEPYCPAMGDQDWQMLVDIGPSAGLRTCRSQRGSLAIRHRDDVLAVRAIGHHHVDSRLQAQVSPVLLDPASLDTIAVTALAQYQQCPLAYQRQFVLDEPPLDARWGLGRLDTRAPATAVGQFAHTVLALVGREGPETLERAIAAAQDAPADGGQLSSPEQDMVRDWIDAYLRTPTYATIVQAADRLRSEASLSFLLDEVLVTGQIDAIAEMADGSTHVLDFKIGRESAAAEQQYRLQIGLYCEALRRARGRMPKSAILIYLTTGIHRQLHVADTAEEAVTGAREMLGRIREGLFTPAPSSACQVCGYRMVCEDRAAEQPRQELGLETLLVRDEDW